MTIRKKLQDKPATPREVRKAAASVETTTDRPPKPVRTETLTDRHKPIHAATMEELSKMPKTRDEIILEHFSLKPTAKPIEQPETKQTPKAEHPSNVAEKAKTTKKTPKKAKKT